MPEQTRPTTRLRDLPVSERPRERLQQYGAQAVSTIELVAVLIGTGHGDDHVLRLAEQLVLAFDGLDGLARASLAQLKNVTGVGDAKATRLKAAFELSRRANELKLAERPFVASPIDAANLLMPRMSRLEQEELHVMMLNTRNRVIGIPSIYTGSLNTSVVRLAEVFRPPIIQNAAAVIVAHNHPSGDPSPSPEDVLITREMVRMGEGLSIPVQDHLIIGLNTYVSLRERGLGFG